MPQARSTSKQKRDWLRNRRARISRTPLKGRKELTHTLAREAVAVGLYSKSTGLRDTANGIESHIQELGIW